MRPIIPACEYCNNGNPHSHTEESLRAEIERLHEVSKRETDRHRETVDRWVKTADEEREKKEVALLQIEAMRPVVNAARDYADAFSGSGEINDTAKGLRIIQEMLRALERLDEFIAGPVEKRVSED